MKVKKAIRRLKKRVKVNRKYADGNCRRVVALESWRWKMRDVARTEVGPGMVDWVPDVEMAKMAQRIKGVEERAKMDHSRVFIRLGDLAKQIETLQATVANLEARANLRQAQVEGLDGRSKHNDNTLLAIVKRLETLEAQHSKPGKHILDLRDACEKLRDRQNDIVKIVNRLDEGEDEEAT